MRPWLDEMTEHCGQANMLDIESYIDLDRPELLAILSSDPIEMERDADEMNHGVDGEKDARLYGEQPQEDTEEVNWSCSLAL